MKSLPFFYEEISHILPQARQKNCTIIHAELIMLYWRIGQRMVEKEQRGASRAGYGHFVIKEFSEQLSRQFGRGFSIANVKNFRQFYLAFPEKKAGPFIPCANLGWTHYRMIMQIKDPEERQRLIREASEQNWSTRQLKSHVIVFHSKARNSNNSVPKKKKGPPEWPFNDVNSFMQWLTEEPESQAAVNIPDSVSNSGSATARYWGQGRGAGKYFPDQPF